MCGIGSQDNRIFRNDKHLKAYKWSQRDKEANYSITTGSVANIITSINPQNVTEAVFGYNKLDDKGRRKYCFNVRSEGGFNNKGNSPIYAGPWGISKNPWYKDDFLPHRGIMPVTHFGENPEGDTSRKFLVTREDKTPFYIGVVYNPDPMNPKVDLDTGEIIPAFSIVTTAKSKITSAFGHHRSPLLFSDFELALEFTNPNLSTEQVDAYFGVPDSEGFVAYEVNPRIAKKKKEFDVNDPTLIAPIGDLIHPIE